MFSRALYADEYPMRDTCPLAVVAGTVCTDSIGRVSLQFLEHSVDFGLRGRSHPLVRTWPRDNKAEPTWFNTVEKSIQLLG